jgi:glycine cleavage system H protein
MRRPQPCVWMSAGILNYKLCDRDFDCELCPLDSALRGPASPGFVNAALLCPGGISEFFPDDRVYSSGHSWVQTTASGGGASLRFGLDAFAAAMIGRCGGVGCHASAGPRAVGDLLCEVNLGLGVVFIASPVATTCVTKNEKLERNPDQLIVSPYEDGWIGELTLADTSQLSTLMNARAAHDHARLDLRHFRRQVAMHFFADAENLGPCLPDGGEPVDLRQMLAGPAYLELIRQLIH